MIIGDVDLCRAQARPLLAIGTDRLMCLMQFGTLPHARVLASIRLVGEHLIPHFAKLGPA